MSSQVLGVGERIGQFIFQLTINSFLPFAVLRKPWHGFQGRNNVIAP